MITRNVSSQLCSYIVVPVNYCYHMCYASIAQLAEQAPHTGWVAGSIPARGTDIMNIHDVIPI